ncbi:uncharacterized protein PAC_13693 [Phialocephala subalpina]|uniref:F-box domain-containing protein n=1 Tax=Phialocephala subalpina TaxID=576137 RepID=A0A1L7XFP7_9HELO|nr:uncharacterized protein PAC_13693 [Phialocephala subalpina]
MAPKRRRSSTAEQDVSIAKRTRTRDPNDHLSSLSDELLIRILHLLPITTLLQCQLLSHRLYRLSSDAQIWKNLYYNRFVLPRALRIPGIRHPSKREDLHFSSRKSKWLDEASLVERKDGGKTNWKRQYKLRHNWSIGACEVQEIRVKDGRLNPGMLVKLAEGVVVTADREDGLRAWNLKGKGLIARMGLGEEDVPTCLAVDEQESDWLGIAVGFDDGGWGIWKLDVAGKVFVNAYRHPASNNGTLGAVAYGFPYALTITEGQLLSLYSFAPAPLSDETPAEDEDDGEGGEQPATMSGEQATSAPAPNVPPQNDKLPQPRLLASLKSHTSWPPLSLSIRTTPNTLIASIAYSLPTYLSGYTVGLQELHLSLPTGLMTFSRLTSALPQGFSSILSSSPPSPSRSGSSTPTNSALSAWNGVVGTSSPRAIENTRPTTLSYSHPYILATHPDNTLTLYLCTSTSTNLSISPGTKLWGHTSEVSAAEITPRGKAVSVSLRGEELRVWELEGGRVASASTSSRFKSVISGKGLEKSVIVRGSNREFEGELDADEGDEGRRKKSRELERYEEEVEASKRWVGFDDEMVIVLKESGRGTQALMVYDFT